KLVQTDSDGNEFAKHEFSYFDDVRDGQGAYQGFGSAQWAVPGDGLTLDGSVSRGSGVHAYVGVAQVSNPRKAQSVGAKVGSANSSSEGVVALTDVDGDGLPDKVFRSGGVVKYRKNLAKPGGQLAFEDTARVLGLPGGFLGERSKTFTVGPEGYAGGVAAQLNYVETTSETGTYFHDVNGDGITDVVADGGVLFGRLNAAGVPVYGVSGDTPVPVDSRQVDTSKLFGDYSAQRERLIDSFPLLDTVRRWVAPLNGTVKIEGPVKLAEDTAAARAASTTADGVKVAIQREESQLWSAQIGAKDNTSRTPSGVSSVAVTKGQRLYFRVQSVSDGSLDEVEWNPVVTYLNVSSATVDVNDLAVYRYEAGRDFTVGGRAAQVKAPLTGSLHLSGDFVLSRVVSDDVTVVISKAGAPVLQHTIAAGTTGTVPVNLGIPVAQGQVLTWRVKTDSPIDLSAIDWLPKAHYTAAEGVERVVDGDGKPSIVFAAPYEVDMYPVNDLTGPQAFRQIPAPVEEDTCDLVSIVPQLAFNFAGQSVNGRVAFTVKKAATGVAGALVAKRYFTIVNGHVTAPGPVSWEHCGPGVARLAVDFSTSDPALRTFLTSRSVTVNGFAVQSGFHSAAVAGAFPQPYRGWGAIGYNGNRAKAGQPIVQSDLVLDESYDDGLPEEVDPQDPQQRETFENDPKVAARRMVPFTLLADVTDASRDGNLPPARRWGTGQRSWVTGDRMSSSRLGAESINVPGDGDFAGIAVPRMSRSTQFSVTGSVGGGVGSAGGSIATGESTGLLDFVDMNGDGFPDVVSSRGIQYTDPDGGLGADTATMPDGAVRVSDNESGNASAGSAGRTIGSGRGDAAPKGNRSAATSQAGNDMPPFGVGGELGGSDSDAVFDLVEVNGDGLPDRVYADGKVALNLGYRFGNKEQWRNPAALNDGGGKNTGMNLGFNFLYGFAGGASFQESKTSTDATLTDMNGDGLTDRVLAGESGQPIRVGFNTGNGFEAPVPFHGSLSGIARDLNTSFGSGAYVETPVCFLAVCVVLNPGAHKTVAGTGRAEQALRDINGDGYVDHVESSADDELVVKENKTGRTNLLKSVSRPLG
ncbi:hypothetical protein, partial [Kribbella deserti]